MASKWIESLDARRLLVAYAPDISFGTDGVLPPSKFAYGPDTAVTVVHQDSRGMLVASSEGFAETSSLQLSRYTLDGQPDLSFTPRRVSSTEYLAARPYGDRQGRMLLAFSTESGRFQVTRYSADGAPDRSFGKKGTATTADVPPVGRDETASYPGSVHNVNLTDGPDGSVFLTGYRTVYTAKNDEVHQHFVYKLTAAGQIDTGFGGGVLFAGTNTLFGPLSTSEDATEFFFAVDPQGRLVVGQTVAFGKFSFTRFTAAGRVDTSYGDNGTFLYDVGPSGFSTLAFHPAFDTQGRALLLAEAGVGSKLLRLTMAGRLDTTFGDNGFVSTRGYPQALIVQTDGKLVAQVAAGSVYFLRLNADGSRDTTFGPDGLVSTVQTENVAEQINYQFSSTPTKLLTELADGTYLTAVSTRSVDTVEKIAAAVTARRGSSGKLYLLGVDGADKVTVSRNATKVTRVVFNGRVTNFTKGITAIVTNLIGGDNSFDAPVDVPQTVSTAGGNDTVTTGDADDTVFTRDGRDMIHTHGGYDTIHFYGGDKDVDAGSGSGYVTGGPSGNTVASAGRVRVVGTTTDGSTKGGWKVDVRGTGVSVTLGGGSAQIGVTASQTAAIDVGNLVSRVSAEVSGKRVTFDARRATVNLTVAASIASTIRTGPGDDTVRGGSGTDTVDAGGGNDRVYGYGGDDHLTGGEGDDVLVGGGGNDTLFGNAGNDRLYAGDPNDHAAAVNFLFGGEGFDGYQAESDDDRLNGVERLLGRPR